MVVSVLETAALAKAQHFMVPACHSWQQFKAMQTWADGIPGLRITFLEGWIELVTTGKTHGRIKKFMAILLELYFFEMGIKFFPASNSTCEAESL